MRGLYIHVPFCLSKCPYCDFYSEKYSASLSKDYAGAVKRELGHYPETFDTVYFGGGTPALLSEEIPDILGMISVSGGAEITAECNPCISRKERLSRLFSCGVNRLSLGVQSLSDRELKAIGRRHSSEQAKAAVMTAYEAGFRDISVDIMLGLPFQDEGSISATIAELSALPVTHVSAYMLKIEENTPFYADPPDIPDGDRAAELYLFAAELLEKNGFTQYEISSFAKKGYECRHNLKYWRCEEYLGIGAAAHSYYNGKRFRVPRDLRKFISGERQETEITDENAGGFDEFAMLRLRLSEGLSFSECERFGVTEETLLERCEKVPREYINVTEKGVSLTREGFLVSNAVIGKILGY